MAKIKHIAVVVEDSEKMAEFYKSAFGWKKCSAAVTTIRSRSGRSI